MLILGIVRKLLTRGTNTKNKHHHTYSTTGDMDFQRLSYDCLKICYAVWEHVFCFKKEMYDESLTIMGIVRKLLTRRIYRKNNYHHSHPTREAMVILVFQYQIYLCSTYRRTSTRFYAKSGSARIPKFFKVLKSAVHCHVRDTFFVWKFLSDLPFQLYSLQLFGLQEVQNAARSGELCHLLASGTVK